MAARLATWVAALAVGGFLLEGVRAAEIAENPGISIEVAVRGPDGAVLDAERTARLMPVAVKDLQARLDPEGAGRFAASEAGGDRLRVRMALSPEGVKAWSEAKEADVAFEKTVLNPEEIAKALSLQENEREAAIDAIAPANSARNEVLKRLASALDSCRAAMGAVRDSKDPTEEQTQRLVNRSDELATAAEAVGKTTLSGEGLEAIVAPALADEDKHASTLLEQVPIDYPGQADAIVGVIAARKRLLEASGRPDSPREVEALIGARGVLEFRIVVGRDELSPLQRALALEALVTHGSAGISLDQGLGRWFALSPDCELYMRTLVTASWNGAKYVLLRDDEKGSLTHAAGRPAWVVTVKKPFSMEEDGPLLPFQLDKAGAAAMLQLTKDHVGHSMAVLVDDRPVMVANIASSLSDNGVVTFGRPDQSHPLPALRQRAERMYRLMSAGEHPMTYQVLP